MSAPRMSKPRAPLVVTVDQLGVLLAKGVPVKSLFIAHNGRTYHLSRPEVGGMCHVHRDMAGVSWATRFWETVQRLGAPSTAQCIETLANDPVALERLSNVQQGNPQEFEEKYQFIKAELRDREIYGFTSFTGKAIRSRSVEWTNWDNIKTGTSFLSKGRQFHVVGDDVERVDVPGRREARLTNEYHAALAREKINRTLNTLVDVQWFVEQGDYEGAITQLGLGHSGAGRCGLALAIQIMAEDLETQVKQYNAPLLLKEARIIAKSMKKYANLLGIGVVEARVKLDGYTVKENSCEMSLSSFLGDRCTSHIKRYIDPLLKLAPKLADAPGGEMLHQAPETTGDPERDRQNELVFFTALEQTAKDLDAALTQENVDGSAASEEGISDTEHYYADTLRQALVDMADAFRAAATQENMEDSARVLQAAIDAKDQIFAPMLHRALTDMADDLCAAAATQENMEESVRQEAEATADQIRAYGTALGQSIFSVAQRAPERALPKTVEWLMRQVQRGQHDFAKDRLRQLCGIVKANPARPKAAPLLNAFAEIKKQWSEKSPAEKKAWQFLRSAYYEMSAEVSARRRAEADQRGDSTRFRLSALNSNLVPGMNSNVRTPVPDHAKLAALLPPQERDHEPTP